MEQQLADINKKLDTILELLSKTKVNEWTVEDYTNGTILIKFPYNEQLKNLLKSLGGRWVATKKAWMFSKEERDHICKDIHEKFPDWKCIELN